MNNKGHQCLKSSEMLSDQSPDQQHGSSPWFGCSDSFIRDEVDSQTHTETQRRIDTVAHTKSYQRNGLLATQIERFRSNLQEEERPEGRLLSALGRAMKCTLTHTHAHRSQT